MSSAALRLAKAVAIYSLLVVPPVAGLLAILHLGDDLHPPRSIGGTWQLSGSAPACRPFEFGDKPVTLAISQSGLRAVGKLSDVSHTTLSIMLDGDAIAGEQSTGGGHAAIAARIGATSDLVGVLRWPGCAGCAEQPFRASRTGGRR